MDATGPSLGHFLGQLAQLGKDFGILFGEVFAFSDILFQIVEFLRFGTVILPGVAIEMSLGPEVLPLAEADARPVEVVLWPVPSCPSANPSDRFRRSYGLGASNPHNRAKVGKKSMVAKTASEERPAGTLPGQRTMQGNGNCPHRGNPCCCAEDRCLPRRPNLGVALLFQGTCPGSRARCPRRSPGCFAQLEFVQNVKQAPGLVIEPLHHVPAEPPISPEAVGCVDDGVHHGGGPGRAEGLLRISPVLKNRWTCRCRVVSPPMSLEEPAARLFS